MKTVSLIRLAGQHIPAAYLTKLASEYNSGMCFAFSSPSGRSVIVRKNIGEMTLEEIQEIILSDKLKDKNIVFNFFKSTTALTEEDIAPYVILETPMKDQPDKILPICVAFLSGDFSQFAVEGDAHPGEYHCVKKQVSRRIMNLFKTHGNRLPDLFEELKDELTQEPFGNMMSGENGSIIFMGAGDLVQPIVLASDKISDGDDNFWTSDNLEEQVEQPVVEEPVEQPGGGMLDGLDDEGEGGYPAKAKPVENKHKPVIGLKGKANAEPAPKADPVVVPAQPQPGDGKGVQPDVKPSGTPDLTDPEAKLTLNIPHNINPKKKATWVNHRVPEGLMPKSVNGLKSITLARKDCNAKFLTDYCRDNKLSLEGLAAVDVKETSTAAVKEVNTQATKVSVPAAGTKDTDKPKQVTSASVAEKQRDNKNTSTKHISNMTDAVTFTEPQIEHMKTFVEDKSVQSSIETHKELLASPQGLETLEKKVQDISKQFGGVINIQRVASWPLDVFIKYVQHDPVAGAKLAFALSVDLHQAYRMLDEVSPIKSKPEEKVEVEATREPKVLESQVKASSRPNISFPKRKVA